MKISACTISLLPIFFAVIILAGGDSNSSRGFRVELYHVDANLNFTKLELIHRASQRSQQRLLQLTATSEKLTVSTSKYSAPIHAGNGEFLMELAVGTPPLNFSAIVDTGSDLIWTQCKPCINCFHQPTPIFDPTKSSSYSSIDCSDRLCAAVPTASCSSVARGCQYFYSYGDSSYTQGLLAKETFSIGLPGGTTVPEVAFGCGEDNEGGGFPQGSGLVGLGRGPLSLISQLNLSRFSYCLTSLDEPKTSFMLFGDLAALNASTTTKLVRGRDQQTFYYLPLKGISVGGEWLAIPNGVFELKTDGSGGLIIDSGTSITYLEEEGYRAIKKAFLKGMKLPSADGGDVGLDLCFKAPTGVEEVEVPKMVLHFEGGGEGGAGGDLELPAENYMMLDMKTGYLCLTVMGSRGMSILGNYQQQNIHVLYDLVKETVSFEPTKCHLL